MYANIHKGLINVSAQENGFKLFSRWYNPPLKLHRIYPTIPPTCWRCQDKEDSLLHIWWECPLIQKFWLDVHCHTTQITTPQLDFSPAQTLLHHSTLPTKTYHQSLALHLINAAKMCIPVHWRSPQPPTIAEWIKHVNKVAEMEDHQAHDTSTT